MNLPQIDPPPALPLKLCVFHDVTIGWYAWYAGHSDDDPDVIYFRKGCWTLFNVAPTWFDTYKEAKMALELCGFKAFGPNESI